MTFDFNSIPHDAKARLDKMSELAFTTQQGLYHTYLCAGDVIQRHVPGVFVECGVANGAQVGAMALAVSGMETIHLFDSFQGIPLCGPKDNHQPGATIAHDVMAPLEQRLVSSGVSVQSRAKVAEHLVAWGFQGYPFVYHEGWFQDTLPKASIDKIALLRLDGDLYESTLECLEHLYPKVSPGGIVIVDDFGTLAGCRAAVVDYFFNVRGENLPEMDWPTDYGCVSWRK